MHEIQMDFYGKEEDSFGPSFAEPRAAMSRQRHREQAMGIVTVLLTLMVGVLTLKMYGMSATIEELSAASLSLSAPAPRTRPDYVKTAEAFVGGYTLYGHVLTDNGVLTSFNVAQECICECNGTSTGIFCRGANPMTEFLAVAATEPGVEGWKMSKWCVCASQVPLSHSRLHAKLNSVRGAGRLGKAMPGTPPRGSAPRPAATTAQPAKCRSRAAPRMHSASTDRGTRKSAAGPLRGRQRSPEKPGRHGKR